MASLIVMEDLAGPASIGRGGLSMLVLQWLHGLRRLGHRVLFIEFLREHPGSRAEAVVSFFRETIESWWEPSNAALMVEESCESLYGMKREEVTRFAADAAALVTLAARYHAEPYPLIGDVRPRILIEQDPGYTHLWAAQGNPAAIFGQHDLYFTVGVNIGTSRCSLPTLGIQWRPIWNPAVLDWWSAEPQVRRDCFTTAADWRSYGYLDFEGQVLGPKAEEFRKFIDLPKLAGEPIEMVLNIDDGDPDIELLQSHNWRLLPPSTIATPRHYMDFVSGSLGEFSCVKGGYAGTHSGWFSDRSACYLAAGRPVVLQSTGFEDALPTGRGLFAVRTVEEAAEALKEIRADYALHSQSARAIAREHFSAETLAQQVLAEAGIASPQYV